MDNGFIFDWFVNFEPSLYPDPIVFTPHRGGLRQQLLVVPSSWTTEEIATTSPPWRPGHLRIHLTAINDFGCTATDTTTVTVEPAPEVDLVAADNWCGVPVGLTATTQDVPNLNVDWSWETTDGPGRRRQQQQRHRDHRRLGLPGQRHRDHEPHGRLHDECSSAIVQSAYAAGLGPTRPLWPVHRRRPHPHS